MGKTFWGVVGAAVEQSRGKANVVAQGDGKFNPQDPSKPKKKIIRSLNHFIPKKLARGAEMN